MPFPTTPVLDNFNRPDQGPPPSASWTTPLDGFGDPLDGCRVVSNQVTHQAGAVGTFGYASWNAATFGPDCEIYATLKVAPGTQAFRLHARMGSLNVDGYNNSYFLNVTNAGIQIFKSVNGTNTQLGTLVRSNAIDESFGLELIGSTLKAYYKPVSGSWTLAITVTDTTYTAAGRLGMLISVTPSSTLDDFGGGTVAVAGPTITTTSLPDGEVGKNYSQTVQATGGTTPYTWSIMTGALPSGTSLNASTGVISGMPNAAGLYTFEIKVTDALLQTDTQSLSIQVAEAAPGSTISSTSGGGDGDTRWRPGPASNIFPMNYPEV